MGPLGTSSNEYVLKEEQMKDTETSGKLRKFKGDIGACHRDIDDDRIVLGYDAVSIGK